MFFIIEGKVDILSPDFMRVIRQLEKNNYIGELAMLHQIKRTASVVATTFCLLYVLKKDDFDSIIMVNSDLKESLQKASNFRLNAVTPDVSPDLPKKMMSADVIIERHVKR
jgi:F-box/leucine-rich repeat protein 7